MTKHGLVFMLNLITKSVLKLDVYTSKLAELSNLITKRVLKLDVYTSKLAELSNLITKRVLKLDIYTSKLAELSNLITKRVLKLDVYTSKLTRVIEPGARCILRCVSHDYDLVPLSCHLKKEEAINKNTIIADAKSLS